MSIYKPQDDNALVETDRVLAFERNEARTGPYIGQTSGWYNGWTLKSLYNFLASNDWQGEDENDRLEGLVMTWHGDWKAREYKAGSVVRDGLWTMVAKYPTSDKPAPELAGSAAWFLTPAPTWATQTPTATLVITGTEFMTSDADKMILGLRVYIPEVAAGVEYRVIFRKFIAEGIYRDILNEQIYPLSTGWFEMVSQGAVLDKAATYQFLLLASNSATTTDFSAPYAFSHGTANYLPLSGEIYNKTNDNLLRINSTDYDMIDQTANLSTIIVGTKIEFENGAVFTVDTVIPPSQNSFDFYGNFSGFPAVNNQTVTFKVPTAAATQYVEEVDYWTTNPPAAGTALGMVSLDGAPATYNNNAYGVDIFMDGITASPNWDVVALSDDLSP